MVKQTIQIFARIKPTKAKTGLYEINDESDEGTILSFNVPRDLAGGYVNNKKEDYKFKFQKLFDRNAKQDEIFEDVAKGVIDNVLQGYNGTIFAYGQTGSGKTFTITGGPERYADRGIIPRTISYIFEHVNSHPECVFTVHVSYLEIYNDSGYDLLDPKHEAAKLEDLPKVSLMEDADQNIHLKNLSTHQASEEADALNLLFLGDTNRMIAETPMNMASTRSHCIFTIHISSRETGSATIRRSKLHLVDLAGSERVSKSGVNGVLLTEAKYINLSLHYLEQVIVSLSEKGRGHIPYRNSMMTSVLRDSLGGNCMTTMIATCSVDKKNLDESISTCRFAQRVAMIKNDALLNEELDPQLIIARMKRELAQMKDELAMATGEQRTDVLSEEDLERCREAVEQYLNETDPEANLNVGADMRKLNQCFKILKQRVLEKGGPVSSVRSSPSTLRENPGDRKSETYLHSAEAKELRERVMQRDNEINILVNMLKKEKKRAQEVTHTLESLGHNAPPRPASSDESSRVFSTQNGNGFAQRSQSVGNTLASKQEWSPDDKQQPKRRDEVEEKVKKKILGDLSIGRQEAFEIFRRDYEHNAAIEENKKTLKSRYAEAKKLGESIKNSRDGINKSKSAIEHHRMTSVMQGLVDPDNPQPDEREQQLREHMEREKAVYKDVYQRLKDVKTETEHLQHLLEKSKMQLMKDFELWWAEQAVKLQTPRERPPSSHTKAAWRTPPITPQLSSCNGDSSSGHRNQSSGHRNPSSGHGNLSSTASSLQSDRSTDSHIALNPLKQHSAGGCSDISGYSSSSSSVVSTPSQRPPSGRNCASRPQEMVGRIQLTGDEEVDADIRAFMAARQRVKQAQQSPLR